MQNKIITMLLLLAPSVSLASEIETILEWEGEIHTTKTEEMERYCLKFPGEKQDIKNFFNQAVSVKETKIPNSMCSASGVARTEGGEVVDWKLFQGGVGYIVNGNKTIYYVCKKGSKCCNSLPHICNIQP